MYNFNDTNDIKRFFKENGYVVITNVLNVKQNR